MVRKESQFRSDIFKHTPLTMNFNRKKIALTLLITLGTGLVLVILFLELASKKYYCPTPLPPSVFSCVQKVQPKMGVVEREKLLADFKSRIATGDEITKEEFRQAAENLILKINPNDLGRLNGIACSNVGYVRNDLSAEATKFVQRHELEHLLQAGTVKNREFSANIAAAKEYPWGLLSTITFSLRERAKYYDSSFCYISSLWKTFKVYFIP
jgi:hypothetical protein